MTNSSGIDSNMMPAIGLPEELQVVPCRELQLGINVIGVVGVVANGNEVPRCESGVIGIGTSVSSITKELLASSVELIT